jgi:hypothetical protein
MEPIVHGLTQQFRSCLNLERVNYHTTSPWCTLVNPLGEPQFAFVDQVWTILYRWSGVTEQASDDEKIQPC